MASNWNIGENNVSEISKNKIRELEVPLLPFATPLPWENHKEFPSCGEISPYRHIFYFDFERAKNVSKF